MLDVECCASRTSIGVSSLSINGDKEASTVGTADAAAEVTQVRKSKKQRPTVALEWRDVNFSVDVQDTSCCGGRSQDEPKTKQILQVARPDHGLCYHITSSPVFHVRWYEDLCGQVVPEQLLALMGPSGAGKTTLLNVLSGINSKHTGDVLLNGVEQHLEAVCSLRAAGRSLSTSANIIRAHYDHCKANKRTDLSARLTLDAIEMLGLTKCKNTVIGEPGVTRGISGGERKRLSIASEILNDPSLIFLDEPTSGLDSFMAEVVIQQLRELASDPQRPRTIIATIHQPSSQTFALFDYLNLIAEGRNAYFGPADQAVNYFDEVFEYKCPAFVNPSDFFLSLLSPQVNKEAVQRVCDQYTPHASAQGAPSANWGQTDPEAVEVVFKSRYPSRWYTQLWELAKRALIIKARPPRHCIASPMHSPSWNLLLAVTNVPDCRNPREMQVQIFQALFFSIIIGFLYFQLGNNQKTVQNVNGLLFMSMMMMAMSQISPTIEVFAGDMPMFLREHKNGLYSITALYAARNISDLALQLLLPATFGTIVFFMAGLPFSSSTFFTFIFILALHGSAGASMGYCIGCAAPSANAAQALMPLAVLPQMFLAGFMINLDSIPVFIAWAKHISFFRYTYQALLLNLWDSWGNIPCDGATRCAFKTGKEVVTYLSLDADDAPNLPQSLFALMGLAVGFRILAWLILWRRASNFITADA